MVCCRFSIFVMSILLLSGCGDNKQEGCIEDDSKACTCGDETGTSVCGTDGTYGECSCETEDDGDSDSGTISVNSLKCAAGYTCYEKSDSDEGVDSDSNSNANVIWVMKNDGNVNGPSCKDVCEGALSQNCDYHACDEGHPVDVKDLSEFETIAKGLGFSCREGGCWPDAPGEGLILVSINTNETDGTKACFLPTETTLSCNTHPGNANCFGERYSSVCPCMKRPLDEACQWECGPNHTTMATWKTTGTSCVERINYWRKKACEDGWVECPPAGLPPMVECTACHECANSQAAWDKEHGAHDSFKRCGESVQGEGGGATCADVIDSFVSERKEDENGVMRCQGHCGPIVKHGCQTFHWGKDKDSGFHTLNWRSCNEEKCNTYCDENPGDCYTHETSPYLTCDDPAANFEPGPEMTCEE